MSLINTSLPNLVQGVSQQPDTLKFDGQGKEQINALSSVADGLKKRPNSRYVKQLIADELDDGAFVHFINRDKNEKYVLIIDNTITANTTTVRVYEISSSNSVITLNDVQSGSSTFTSTNDYLFVPANTKPKDVLKALTVGDTTFILNTTKKVTRKTAAADKSKPFSDADNNKALVFVKQGDFHTDYSIEIEYANPNDSNNIKTVKAVFTSQEAESTGKGPKARGGLIAHNIKENLKTAINNTTPPPNTESGDVALDGFTISDIELYGVEAGDAGDRYGYPAFSISRTDGVEFKIKVSDSKGGTALGLAYKEVDSISDLPKSAPNNFRIKVRGSVEDNEDDFFVKFETNDGTTSSDFSDGGFIEDVGFDEFITLDENTLPFKLVNNSPNNFDLNPCNWKTKQVGDNDTNPFPSFFNLDTNSNPDRSISNLFFFKNRLGFLSEGSVILSEAGEYFNFFRTTVRSLIDSDPIDINVASKKVTKLKSAVAFQENLILFGERGQFVLRGGELLTPKTVSITPVTNFETDTSTTPLELGSYIYFPFTRGSFSGIREFTVNASTDIYDSVEITAHVPQYIPSSVLDIAGSTSENLICLVSNNTADETKNMYIYKYYWQGNEKLLSSWSKFTFPFNIRGIEFVESDLFIVAAKNNKTELLKIPMEEKLTDINTTFTTYLDMRVEDTVSSTGQITLPYTPDSSDEVQVYSRESGDTKAGAKIPASLNGNVLTISGHNLMPVWVGIKYEMSYTFSEQLFKQRANRNKSPSGYQRHFLKGGTLFFDDSSSFRVEVTPKARKTYKNVFSSTIIGATTIGTLPIESGSFSFPIMSSAKDTMIKIVNDSALPANFQSAEFESFIHSRSKRV